MRNQDERRSGMDRRRHTSVSLAPQGIERRWDFDPRSSTDAVDAIYGFNSTTSEDDWETFFNIHIRE